MGTNTPPIKPVGTPTKITVASGESLSVLAVKYNTTVDMIKKANNMKSDNLREGQTITINVVTDAELKKYQQLKSQYDQKVAAEKEKKEVAKRTEKAAKLIEKANKDGYAKDYSFSINDKGHILIKLKTEKMLGEIASDFGLAPGVLRNTNPSIEQKYKKGKAINHNGDEYETYNTSQAKPGHTFVIDTDDFHTVKTWSQTFKDFYQRIKFW